VLLLVSLTEERATYFALELDRSWTEMTEVTPKVAQLIWAPLGHQKSMMPAQCKLHGRRLWPVTGTCPSTPLIET